MCSITTECVLVSEKHGHSQDDQGPASLESEESGYRWYSQNTFCGKRTHSMYENLQNTLYSKRTHSYICIQVTCRQCESASFNYEPFTNLSLELNDCSNVTECLRHFTTVFVFCCNIHALLRCHAVSEALHKGCVCVILVRNSMGDGHQCGNCNHIRAHTHSLRFLLSLPVPHSLSHCHSLTLAPCLSRTPMRSQSETLGDSNAYQCDKCNHKAIVPQKSAL